MIEIDSKLRENVAKRRGRPKGTINTEKYSKIENALREGLEPKQIGDLWEYPRADVSGYIHRYPALRRIREENQLDVGRAIQKLWDKGFSATKIGEITGCSQGHLIRKKKTLMGAEKRERGRPRGNIERGLYDSIKYLLATRKNISQTEIGDLWLGRSRFAIHEYIKKYPELVKIWRANKKK